MSGEIRKGEGTRRGKASSGDKNKTHDCEGVVGVVGHDSLLDAILTAGVGVLIAVANGRPRPPNARTTTREKEVVLSIQVFERDSALPSFRPKRRIGGGLTFRLSFLLVDDPDPPTKGTDEPFIAMTTVLFVSSANTWPRMPSSSHPKESDWGEGEGKVASTPRTARPTHQRDANSRRSISLPCPTKLHHPGEYTRYWPTPRAPAVWRHPVHPACAPPPPATPSPQPRSRPRAPRL